MADTDRIAATRAATRTYSDEPTMTAPDSLTYPSRSGGDAHRISIHVTRRAGGAFRIGERYVTCDCKAGRYRAFIGRTAFPGCWAMVAARRLLSIPAIPQYGQSSRYR